MKLAQESLAHALAGAARALAEVEAGNALPRALSGVFASRPMSPAARGAIQDIAYRSLRRWGEARALLKKLADRPPSPPRLKALLCCALALASEEVPAYAPHTLVDQTVDACAADRELARARGMVNAVLRRFLRERATLLAAVMQDDEARWNYPSWWVDAARLAWPDDWTAVLDAGNHQPPLTLRVNVRRTSIDAYLARLASLDIDAHRIGPVAVRLGRPRPVGEIPGFDDGDVSVQDAAAQLAAPLLAPEAGMRVLDACAAPGGKTGHLLELADVDLVALDQDGERLVRVEQNLSRLALAAELRTGDARARDWWDGRPFDRILADVPCTASGIVRRHPDIRWLRRPTDSARLSQLSAAILDNLWSLLKPGGRLLLATCSLWPEESEQQAQRMVQRHGASLLAAPGQLLPTSGEYSDHDGLFYALLEKPAV
ncbi:MAG: 16S rRNA (cytosine(967)-C(5))-methyltransferase RsmB [Burkholderiaceae bacterium]|nr:16S rRNA (cytosine(967)-C(5))-methyltransferase RsmB [Burkholderiaceae bacterium]